VRRWDCRCRPDSHFDVIPRAEVSITADTIVEALCTAVSIELLEATPISARRILTVSLIAVEVLACWSATAWPISDRSCCVVLVAES